MLKVGGTIRVIYALASSVTNPSSHLFNPLPPSLSLSWYGGGSI